MTTSHPGTAPAAFLAAPAASAVVADVETTSVPHDGDAADDVAIWVDAKRPARSLVIGTDKRGGLALYDLAGRQLRYYGDSMPNNVDVRDGFALGSRRVSVVATSDTATETIRLYIVDAGARRLTYAARRPLATGIGVAGLCMYRSARSGSTYIFVSDNSGTVQQWKLFASGGRIDATKVRTLGLASTTEGCVADDALGYLYVSEEDVGIWRYGAEPTAGDARRLVDSVESDHLDADVEGLALYAQRGGRGYLVASSQGSDSFALYRRSGGNAYVGSFRVVADRIDGVTHTDGIDVTSRTLGPSFPAGVFIAQDDDNDDDNQNFKLVAWQRIVRAGSLTPRTGPVHGRDSTQLGVTYFVDSRAGDDSANGTSAAQAWRTLARAAAAPLRPGDQLLLARGGRWSERLDLAASGTAASPIVVSSYGSGPRPVLERSSTCVALRGSFVTLRDLHVRDCNWAGVEIYGRGNRVEGSVISGNAAGIYVRRQASATTIAANRLQDNNRMSVLTTSRDDDSGAFGILVHGESTEITRNVITGSDAFSYDYGRDGAAIELYGARATYIHHNLGVGNDTFTELGNKALDTRIVYNVVRSALRTSVFLVTRGAGSRHGPAHATTVYHNTVSFTGAASKGVVCHHGCGPDILRMRNNIVAAAAPAYADAPFDEDFDLFSGWRPRVRLGAHTLVAAPGFLDRDRDQRLRAGSIAIDRGVSGLGRWADFLGRAVPADGDGDGVPRPDIGAYEHSGVG